VAIIPTSVSGAPSRSAPTLVAFTWKQRMGDEILPGIGRVAKWTIAESHVLTWLGAACPEP
jgi:hypothetical protein